MLNDLLKDVKLMSVLVFVAGILLTGLVEAADPFEKAGACESKTNWVTHTVYMHGVMDKEEAEQSWKVFEEMGIHHLKLIKMDHEDEINIEVMAQIYCYQNYNSVM